MNKIENEFVPYQIALALKELGFDEPCFAGYNFKDGRTGQFTYPSAREPNTTSEARVYHNDKKIVGAPLYQQAFKFFRERYRFQNILWSGKINTIFYGYDILNIDEQKFILNNSENGGGDCDYDTYEEAELACVVKLIDIVKKQNLKG